MTTTETVVTVRMVTDAIDAQDWHKVVALCLQVEVRTGWANWAVMMWEGAMIIAEDAEYRATGKNPVHALALASGQRMLAAGLSWFRRAERKAGAN